MSNEQTNEILKMFLDHVLAFFVEYSFQILGALLLLIAGWILADKLRKIVCKIGKARNLDPTLTKFSANGAWGIALGLSIIFAMSSLGITITPLIAAIGAGAFGLSLALQGPISNYGAGLAIILTRPFKVGDTITIHGHRGVVEDIQLGATVLKTEDGECITIPNKNILGEDLVNSFGNSVADCTVGIDYAADMDLAISTIKQALEQIDGIDHKMPIYVGIDGFADFSVTIRYRYWVPSLRFKELTFKANAIIFKELKTNRIAIPYPRRDVYLYKSTE